MKNHFRFTQGIPSKSIKDKEYISTASNKKYSNKVQSKTDPDTPDDVIDPLIKDLIEGLYSSGNREVVYDDVHSPIDDDSYGILEALGGG